MSYIRGYEAMVQKNIERENDAKKITTFYKQLKLQNLLEHTEGLDHSIKEDLMFTNKDLLQNIGEQIWENNINYPATYNQLQLKKLENQLITNAVLRHRHYQK